MRATGILLLAAAVALMITAIAGCAERQQASAQPNNQQSASKPPPKPVEGLCKLPDAPPADLTHKPGYQQFVVSVIDASGRPVSGLKQTDFVVNEQTQSFPIAYFRENKNDEPVAIALVVDTSGSMEPKLATVKLRLGNLVENLNPCDEVMLFAFSGKPVLLQPFTTNHEMVAKQMDHFNAYGQTALYNSTKTALQELVKADYPDRRIILITDGIDNTSTATQDEVAAKARKDGVPIYAIGIGDPNASGSGLSTAIGPFTIGGDEAERVDAESLKAFSAAAGGRTFIVPGTAEDAGNGFMNALSSIADTIAQSYAIGVVIPADVTLSSVSVTVVNRPDLAVRSHLFTPPPYSP